MKCFEQKQKIDFQKLRNQAFQWVESTRPNLGEKSTRNHINAIIFKDTLDLMMNRKTLKTYQNDINELMEMVR